ncbi:uncharacterized protein LOC142639898 [Castanea sativa]|uniref:uncharacterized protein LOC142639898 n=1 Tax=Castanea sativa TaxID=21020 RepID=UPI003F650A12
MPRTSVKGQVITDLVVEFVEPSLEEHTKRSDMDEKLVGMISLKESLSWKVYVAGAANQRGSGVGLVIISPDKIVIEKSLRMGFLATNNEVEYEALLIGMTMVQKMGGKNVEMFLDSRNRNPHADSLATLATSSAQSLPRVILVEDLYTPTKINVDVVYVHQIKMGPSWMDLVVLYLKESILPEEKSEADKVRRKAPRFWLFEDQKLYKRSFSGPYLLCMHPEATELLLIELHEGICESHTGGRSLSHRALTQGYWWPNMQKEALEYVKKCDQCQRFAPNIHQPRGVLNPLSSPWPFAQWGLDIVGPFLKAAGNKRFLLVGTDYFTKWVETEPLSNIRDLDARRFAWKNIVTRFGISHTLILDNGVQFDSKAFRRYCCDLGITNRYFTPAYPQGNG